MNRQGVCLVALLAVAVGVIVRGAGPETYGTAPALAQTTPIAQVIAGPQAFDKKTVRVEGVVTAVCQMMGCWMGLAPVDAPQGKALLIKVDDGVIVFPTSARGKRATVQGVVERVGMEDAEGQEAAREHAEQGGAKAASPEAGWQLKATGAIIY